MKNKLGGVFAFGGMAWLALSVLAGCGAGDPGEDNGFDADEAPAVGEANSALATPETKVLDAFGSLHGFGDQNPRLVANLDYDNDSDIVAFGAGDIFVSHNLGNGVFTQPELAVAGFGCANQGWRTDLDERVMVDIDNDPTNDDDKDLFAFGGQGTYLLLAVGGMLQTPQWIVHDFGRAQGWRKDMHPRFVANIDSTKPRDLVGFFNDGVFVSRNLGWSNGAWNFSQPVKVVNGLGFNDGWRVYKHPRYVVDITGDGCADLVAFGDAGVWTSRSNCDGSFTPATFVLAEYGANPEAGGWLSVADYPRLMGDINKDGRADIVGFGEGGVWVSLATGDGGFAPGSQVISGFGVLGGWSDNNHIRTLYDVDGDGRQDVVGFGADGVYVAKAVGATLTAATWVSPNWGNLPSAGGWTSPIYYPRSVGTVDTDGKLDVIGFASDGVYVGGLQL